MRKEYDFIILGSGIAGLYCALLAKEHGSVLILTKGKIDDCNTRYAQGGIAAAIGPDDSPEKHLEDTLKAGADLCDPVAVRILAEEGPQRITDLINLGVPFDTIHGEVALAREGAHSVPRVLHAGGDATGQHIELTLVERVRTSGIKVLEHMLATRFIAVDGVMSGVEVLDTLSHQVNTYHGSSVVLATGGAGNIYRYTTNPPVATGDGVALAFRAGVQVMDMEFYQFHPTALRLEGAPTFLLSEAMRGEGAVLRNIKGEAFMRRYHPLGDLAPRDVVARAIVAEMEKDQSNHVLLDVTHLPAGKVKSRFPTIYSFCLRYGLDITTTPIPVAPAAHYMMGGVKTDLWGATMLHNLYACGEVSCNALHGANRLASNSLLDTLVFAKHVVDKITGNIKGGAVPSRVEVVHRLDDKPAKSFSAREPSLSALQDLMWSKVGMVRSASRLEEALAVLSTWGRSMKVTKDKASLELSNLVLVGRLIAEGALIREESRGAHYREDFPQTSSLWGKHIVIAQKEV